MPSFKEIACTKELEARLGEYAVVDVREPHERVDTGYVPTSINLPLATVVDGSAQLPQSGKPLLVVCRSGARSAKACDAILSRQPERDVTNLAGGTLGWIAANLPVARD